MQRNAVWGENHRKSRDERKQNDLNKAPDLGQIKTLRAACRMPQANMWGDKTAEDRSRLDPGLTESVPPTPKRPT
jgi:hypothetical protein